MSDKELKESSIKNERYDEYMARRSAEERLIKGTYKNLINTVSAAILGTTAKNSVTEVGDPS